MNQDTLQSEEKYTKAHQRKRRWYRVVTSLACVVVFCTVYALILPAITMEKNTCGIAEHTHTDNCYTQVTSITRKEPICTAESLDLHQHEESCWDTEGNLICGYADFVVHCHDSNCYDEDGNLWCPLTEIEEHQHDESCYMQQETTDGDQTVESAEDPSAEKTQQEPICGKEEITLHTHQPYVSEEEPGCYMEDEEGLHLTCGKLQILEHQHTDDCFRTVEEAVDTDTLTCTLPEDENHTHNQRCYGTWELTCEIEEHTHSEACQGETELTEEELARVEEVIALIDDLPSSEEVEATLSAFEEADDWDGYEAYYQEISQQALNAWGMYEDLSEKEKTQVTNADKLLELEWLWTATNYAVNIDSVTVYQVNNYSGIYTTLVYGGSVGSKISNMTFTYWDVIIVEKNSNGQLYISQYDTSDGVKTNYKANTSGGFVLLLYNTTVNASVGDNVEVSFDYTSTNGYNSSGYGIVTFKSNSQKLTIVSSADTRDLIEVNLYDYNSTINDLYKSNKKYPGFQQDNGSKNVTSLSQYNFNFGNNITTDLAAGLTSVTNQGGAINAVENSANSPISGAIQKTLGTDGYPALEDGTSLKYLFSNSDYATKANTDNINGLFQHNETTGAYTFNSRENHAQFNSGNNTFTLYKQIITSNYMMYPFGNFLPFNDIVTQTQQASLIDRTYLQSIANSAQYKANNGQGSEYNTLATALNDFIGLMDTQKGSANWDATAAINAYFSAAKIPKNDFTLSDLENIYSIDYDEATDFYFGMEMKMEFMQPRSGLTGSDGKQPMVFYFTGDDDVWVYIDDVLALDLSGIHRHVGGEIDFVNGVVKYYNLDVSTGDVSTTPSKTVKFSELGFDVNSVGTFADYSTHTFNFYYMERGAGSGVCRMNFNFPLLKQNSIAVTKELSVDTGSVDLLGNPDFQFQVRKADDSGLFISNNAHYEILDSTGRTVGTRITDENGIFTIKSGQTAVFSGISEDSGEYFVRELLDSNMFEQYGTVSVNGGTTTTNYNVTVGTDTFTGVDSPRKNISDGTTMFQFNNKVTRNKLGSLSVTKKLITYTGGTSADRFDFHVTLDGNSIPIGTIYTVGTETKKVETEGIITLSSGETATISGILAGSKFTVQETAKSGMGYTVIYEDGNGLTQGSNDSGGYVFGVIQSNSIVTVTVKNTEGGISLNIPGVKIVNNADDNQRTFAFQLKQVTDSTGNTETDGGTTQTVTVDFPQENGAKSKDFSFTLSYLEKDLINNLPSTFYYKITETAEESAANYVVFDSTVYIAEVMVSKDSNGDLTAELTKLYKDGTEVDNLQDSPVSFTNTLISSLTVSKKVEHGDKEKAFLFTVVLEQNSTPLSGNYQTEKTNASGEETVENITFDVNGKAEIQLKDGEKLTISGIPVGVKWNVTEKAVDGYYIPQYVIGSGDPVTDYTGAGTLTSSDTTIAFTNTAGYELPDSGGPGTILYTMGGLLLMIAACLPLYIETKRRKKSANGS